jgi:hypothetical protein
MEYAGYLGQYQKTKDKNHIYRRRKRDINLKE